MWWTPSDRRKKDIFCRLNTHSNHISKWKKSSRLTTLPSLFDGIEKDFLSDGILDALDNAHSSIVTVGKTWRRRQKISVLFHVVFL